jgi:uncharacterized phage infection (PIP) family protein YhgE
MPINKFTTLLDLSRQAKIITGETATFDGKILSGIPFSSYPTGVNTATTVSLGVVSTENAVFSGNTGTTVFDVSNPLSPYYNPLFSGYTATTWTNPLFSATTSGLTLPITILSADTQVVGPFWTLTQTGYTGDYIIGTEYTGYSVTYSFINVSQFNPNVFSGVTSASQENFSAGTLDYKGPLDYLSSKENISVDGRLITNKITISNGASSATTNYVLTQIDDTGKGGWNSLSSLLSGSCLPIVNLETINDCSSGITFNSDVTINGDVIVNGSATTINTEIIRSKDNNIILNYSGTHLTAIGGGFTLEDGVSNGVDSRIYSDSNGVWLFDPSLSANSGTIINFSADTIGSSGDCVNDLYVSNIHSCSPLNVNPLDEGNVYFGSTSGVTIDVTNSRLGIGTETPQYSLDVVNTNSRLYYDPTSFGGLVVISGNTNLPRLGITIAPYLTKPVAGGQLGMRAWDDTLTPVYGKVGDMFTYAGNASNGLNLINSPGTGTEDYIRFYAGQTANGTTPDIHIQGSGVTRGYVGINTSNPQYLLDVVNTNSRLFYDPTSVGGRFAISGKTNVPRFSVEIPPYLTKPQASVSLGIRSWDDLLYPDYGNPGDVHLYAGVNAYGLNIISEYGATSADYIRFYAGQDASSGNTPDIHIQGSGVTRGYVGIGTSSPTERLTVSGTSFFKTSSLTTGTSPSFYYLDGVSTPTDTSTIKSIYKEFRPTTTSSSNVVGDGTLLYPNITSPTNGEFYSKANLILYTGDLSLLNSNEALTSEINVVQIQTNTGTYNDIVKSSSSVLRNLTAGGTINEYVGFWMNGFDITLTHNGSTNNIYGFYMDDQSTRSGNIPPPTNRWGIYIKDEGYNYIAGYLGIGTTTPSEKLDVSGKTKTTTLQVTSGATNGYVLVSDSVGNATWLSASGATSGVTFWTASTGVDAIVVKNSGSVASGLLSLAQGYQTTASGDTSHAEGYQTIAGGNFGSHAEGFQTTASGDFSHAEGADTFAIGIMSHSEGVQTSAIGDYSHAEGNLSTASGATSHAEGFQTIASGDYSHSEGYQTTASGTSSHSEGWITTASGDYSHAEGYFNIASGIASHAEGGAFLGKLGLVGIPTSATTYSSHAEGIGTLASGRHSHAEGQSTIASGFGSHAEGRVTLASGQNSHAEGDTTTASGINSHSEGVSTLASGDVSHAEGGTTIASGTASHAEGSGTTASGQYSHSEGVGNIASGTASHAEGGVFFGKSGLVPNPTSATTYSSHAEGIGTLASGTASHAEGISTSATTAYSHAEGNQTLASGTGSHAEGSFTLALGVYSHAEGDQTSATTSYSHAEGAETLATGTSSHAEGNQTSATTFYSHAEGQQTLASGLSSHAEGLQTSATNSHSHAEGRETLSSGIASHAEGFQTSATTSYSHSEGFQTLASGISSHAEGDRSDSIGSYSHSEGRFTIAQGTASHSEGYDTDSIGAYSHSEGFRSESIGQYSHAEGYSTESTGDYSHSEGYQTSATTQYSHSEGLGTIAYEAGQHVSGKYNNITNANQYFIIGKGTSNASRSNAFRVDSAGNVYGAGATYNSGADYAEYFESLSGDSIPYGTVVELVDDKIKVCVDANNAMGVISSNPTLIGNNEGGTADEWVGKYEKDEWGRYIMEDYSYDMIDYITESGETIYKTITEQTPKLSQNFDPNMLYIPRSERPEWNVVGLVGQVRVLKNQQIPSRWIKMKDINNDIALYLIR